MPTNGDGQGQVPPDSSPDSNGQVPPASQASSNGDDSAHGNNASEPSSTNLTPEQLQDALKKAREQAAKFRVDAKRLAELEAAEQQRKDAELSEKERYEKKLADYQTKLAEVERATQERIVRADIRIAAKEAGIKPELALKLIDYAAIEYSEDGDPTNVAELLAKAVADYGLAPANGQQASTPPQPTAPTLGATNPSRGSQVAGANGRFGRNDIPKLTDPALWKRGS